MIRTDLALESLDIVAQHDAAALIEKEEKKTGKPVPADMQVKLKVDAMLDALIFRLEPATHEAGGERGRGGK
jgi:hypothetical protein